MPIKFKLYIIIILFSLIECRNSEIKPPLIELENFFKNPEKTQFKISPNGHYISYTAPWKNRMNIYIRQLDSDSAKQITFKADRDIAAYFWANDVRILYIKDENGNEDFKLYGVNIDGTEQKCLTCFEGVKVHLIDELKDNPKEIIIGLNKRDSTVFDPYRLNIVNGEMKMLAENKGNIIRWMTDHEGKLRLAIAIEGGVNQTVLYRDSENEVFLPVLKTTWRDEFNPQFFTFDNRMIYALSNLGRDKKEVVIFDPKSSTEIEVLYKNSEVDISKLTYSQKRKVLTTAQYSTEKKKVHFFDEFEEKNFNIIKEKLPDNEVVIASKNRNENIFIIKASSDRLKGMYYLYNSDNEIIKKIANSNPLLNENHLSEMKPIEFTSRDGLLIHGYLTLPKGIAAENLPVVINPHGGPWYRNYWEFNPEVQFLANRGYAVLQINFRGSTGYGKTFWLKSVKQWGGTMQNDITDGVNWLINEGIADKERIAIYGASFGGYAALSGVTFTPDLYSCGIDYVGPANLFTLMYSLPAYWEPMREMFYELVGNPIKDSALLASVSPALHANNIRVPLLIAQGANDPRVKKAESDQMVEALRNRGLEVEYIMKENEGHGFRNEENRLEFYRAMEVFLDKHIGN